MPASPKPADLSRALDLLAFARKMSAAGFEASSLVGATLTPEGLEVSGRSGETEVVALATSPSPPHVHILYSNLPWTLAEPRPTALIQGAVMKLRAEPRFLGRGPREFVVFRR
ncbi:MAG: hypothetical protein R3F14_29010 [Polyangiaceae bacterium]